jgi:hypothetical protein
MFGVRDYEAIQFELAASLAKGKRSEFCFRAAHFRKNDVRQVKNASDVKYIWNTMGSYYPARNDSIAAI